MSAPDANGWLPIETAPKDGTAVIIATKSFLGGVVMASWAADVPEPAFMDESDSYFDASHWQPLPKPPVQHD